MAATASEVAATKTKLEESFIKMDRRFDDLKDSMDSFLESMEDKVNRRERALARHIIDFGEGLQARLGPEDAVRDAVGEEQDQQQQQEVVIDVDDDGIPEVTKKHHLTFKHPTLFDIYCEWHGMDDYYDVPVPGGLEFLEKNFKYKWRKHFSPSETKAFSRLKRVIGGIDLHVSNSGICYFDVLKLWQPMYATELKCSIANFEIWLRRQGLIKTHKARGRKART